MKRFLLTLSLLSVLAFGMTEDDPRSQFLDSYYRGRYEDSHRLLNAAFTDEVDREVWDHRIHLETDLPGCDINAAKSGPPRALALLRLGRFEEARSGFGKDWISLEGMAWLARWNNDIPASRSLIQEAMTLQPDRPELLFFAGKVAASNEETIKYFSRFLELEKEDESRRLAAQNALAFIRKTAGMEVHRLTSPDGVDTIPLNYSDAGCTFKANLDGREIRLMLDTGASGLTLKKQNWWSPQVESEVLLRGLGKSERSPTSVLVLKEFRAGLFQVKNPTATVAPNMPSPDYEGIAGTALFWTHRVLMPQKKGKNLVLLPYDEDPAAYIARTNPKLVKKSEIPFYLVERMMIAKGRIGKSTEEQDIVIDTGSRTSLISILAALRHAHINYPLSRELQNRGGLSGVGGVTRDIYAAENVALSLGGMERSFNVMTALSLMGNSEGVGLEIDMILGRDFLQDYTLLIDYKNRKLAFYQ